MDEDTIQAKTLHLINPGADRETVANEPRSFLCPHVFDSCGLNFVRDTVHVIMKKKPDNGNSPLSDPLHPANCMNPRAWIETHLDIALTGLKWLKENVHDEKIYGNGVEDDVIKSLSDFNDEMQQYFGMAKWGQTDERLRCGGVVEFKVTTPAIPDDRN